MPPVTDPSWKIGYGAGHYCNATADGWKNNFNMYTYITEELPSVCETFFHISRDRKSIMGHSMGGNGALNIAARNPNDYLSVSAFAPITNSSSSDSDLCGNAMKHYFKGNEDEAKKYDCSVSMLAAQKMPPGLIDLGTHDDFIKDLGPERIQEAIGKRKFKIEFRW